MIVEWVIARTFTDPDGQSVTRYWKGGLNWQDKINGDTLRFSNPRAGMERYQANVLRTGKRWQGTVSAIEVPSRDICEPTGKVKYATRQRAERFLIQIWQDASPRAQRNRRELRAYECPHRKPGNAYHWHLTSQEFREELDLPKRVG